MSQDSWDCSGFWLADLLSNSSMARAKVMPQMGEDKRGQKVKTQAQVNAEAQEPWWTHQCQETRNPTSEWAGDKSRGSRQVGRGGEVASHHQPDSWPRWLQRQSHLCLVGRSQPGGSFYLLWGGKAPWKEFLKVGKVKKPHRCQSGTVALHKIWQFQKSMDLLICKLPFSHLVHKIALGVGRYDMHFHMHTILTLQEAA